MTARLPDRIAFVAVAGFLLLSGALIVDMSARLFGTAPIAGLNEIVAVLVAVGVAACLPAGFARGVHLRVDVAERWLDPSSVDRLRWAAKWLLWLFTVLLAGSFLLYAATLWGRGQVTAIREIPLGPFYAFFALALVAGAGLQIMLRRESGLVDDARPRPGFGVVLTALLTLGVVLLLLAGTAPAGLIGGAAAAVLMIGASWVLIVAGVPIGAVLGLTGIAGAAMMIGPLPALRSAALELTPYLEGEQFAVLPLFLLMGSLAARSGLAGDVYRLAHHLLGRTPGGLAIATILGCAGFSAATGSSVATIATMGRIALPEMRARGYATGLASGTVAAGGTLGILIPPSSTLILYALLTEVSIGQMFLAAMVPALMSVALYCLVVALIVAVRPAAAPNIADPRAEPQALRRALTGSIVVGLLGTVLLGGFYGGFLTILQAAGLGVVVTFAVAVIRGALRSDRIGDTLADTVASTAMIYVLLFGGVLFAWFIGLTGVVEGLAAVVRDAHVGPLALVLILVGVYVVLGTVIDPIASLVITAPVVAPLIVGSGQSLVWWGIVSIVVVETGMLHPPLGINVFVLKGVAGRDVRLGTIFAGVIPFVAADLVKLALLIAFPALVLWLPGHMGK